MVHEQQLNGGEVVSLEEKDWDLIRPFLEENERLFGISVERDLLTVDGEQGNPLKIYRKVRPRQAEDLEGDGLEEWGPAGKE